MKVENRLSDKIGEMIRLATVRGDLVWKQRDDRLGEDFGLETQHNGVVLILRKRKKWFMRYCEIEAISLTGSVKILSPENETLWPEASKSAARNAEHTAIAVVGKLLDKQV